jgi:hypothetical protein
LPDPEKSPLLLPAPLPFEQTTVHDPDACWCGFVEIRTKRACGCRTLPEATTTAKSPDAERDLKTLAPAVAGNAIPAITQPAMTH